MATPKSAALPASVDLCRFQQDCHDLLQTGEQFFHFAAGVEIAAFGGGGHATV